MKLSKTSEYAIRILSYMATEKAQCYSAKCLIDKLHISDKYLRRLMTDLTKAGLIYSTQGRNGGYFFAKDPSDISISEIIDIVEGMDKYTGCILGFKTCDDDNPCSMHIVWSSMRDKLVKTFNETKLSDLNKENVIKF